MKKIVLEKEKKYSICSCGLSRVLPLCDNAHRLFNENNGTNYKSVKIIPNEKIEIEVSSSTWKK